MQIERCRVSMSPFRAKLVAWAWALMGGCAGFMMPAGCAPPFNDVLVNESGEQIRSEAVQRILDDDTMTDEEKRDALQRYGIMDEALLDALLRL